MLPLTLLLFAQVSLISPVANAVAIPVISALVTPLALIGVVLPAPLCDWVLQLAHGTLALLAQGLEWLAALPLRDSPDGWSKYVSRLQDIARNPDAKQMAEFEDIARGRPIGTHAWQRAVAREYEHLALEQDVSAAEILPLKQSRWTAALEEALLHHRISPAAIVEARLIPHWKAEVAVRVRRASGAPWRWIAAQLRVPQPASLRAAASWLGRR